MEDEIWRNMGKTIIKYKYALIEGNHWHFYSFLEFNKNHGYGK